MEPDPLNEQQRRALDRIAHPDRALETEWLDQDNLVYGALIGVGVLMVQPFLTAQSLDLAATISVVAFSVAIPLLAALILVNRQETLRGRRTRSILVSIGQAIAQGAACVGFVGRLLAHPLDRWSRGTGQRTLCNRHPLSRILAAGTGGGDIT